MRGGFTDEWALSGMRKAVLARGAFGRGGKGWGCFLSERGNRLSPHGHRDYACMRGGFADEWTLSGVTPAPLARGRGVCCLAGREDQFPPRSHRGYARMRGALPTNGRSPARNRPRLHEGPVSFGRDGEGWGCVFIGARKPAHTAWTPWLCPHAWGLCRRMDALWHETDPPLARGRGVCCLAGREDQFPPRDHRGSARMRGALPTNGRSPARERPRFH